MNVKVLLEQILELAQSNDTQALEAITTLVSEALNAIAESEGAGEGAQDEGSFEDKLKAEMVAQEEAAAAAAAEEL